MGLGKNLIDTLISTMAKMFLFLATVVMWCMKLGKNSIATRPSPKKMYSRFWVQYYCGAGNSEKTQTDLGLH